MCIRGVDTLILHLCRSVTIPVAPSRKSKNLNNYCWLVAVTAPFSVLGIQKLKMYIMLVGSSPLLTLFLHPERKHTNVNEMRSFTKSPKVSCNGAACFLMMAWSSRAAIPSIWSAFFPHLPPPPPPLIPVIIQRGQWVLKFCDRRSERFKKDSLLHCF